MTLSGLLNTIDGPCSKDGRILVMITNEPDALDRALVNPGRIDHKVLFGNASSEVATKLFKHIFCATPTVTDPHGDQLAADFAAKIPAEMLSLAEVQNYLMRHRHNPDAAVAGIENAVQEFLAHKAKASDDKDRVAHAEPANDGASEKTQEDVQNDGN
jgi:chaperone BCS1